MSQIDELIKQNLSVSIHKLIPQYIISVTNAEVSRDLSFAKIWIACLENPEDALKICKQNRILLQHEMSIKVKLRKTPRLSFILDYSSDKVDRIEKLISKIKENP